jgi:hypothetical protein
MKLSAASKGRWERTKEGTDFKQNFWHATTGRIKNNLSLAESFVNHSACAARVAQTDTPLSGI